MYDIIKKKRGGGVLSDEDISFVIKGLTCGQIPDYQVSALLMAIYFKGMNDHETACLTRCMAESGDMIDLSAIPGVKVDKHSTGGVGDKTTLIVAPIVAACGAPVAKMSGRGLGHTGGTLDKLESIPGFQTSISKERFYDIVRHTGLAIIGQSGDIAPADKKLYALRDVTATVDSLPLLASSIMSKKLAAGADAILLDVKTGGGAFMKTPEDSLRLAKAMVSIGELAGRKTVALVTNMDIPLGRAIGNSLEVVEAIAVLKGNGPEDVAEICLDLAANMLYLARRGALEECRKLAAEAVASGKAFNKLKDMVAAQGGAVEVLEDCGLFRRASTVYAVKAAKAGYICNIDTEGCGLASVTLGAGRTKKEDAVDHSAGIILHKKTGERVEKGDVLAELHTNSPETLNEAERMILQAFSVGEDPAPDGKLVYARVTLNGVEYL